MSEQHFSDRVLKFNLLELQTLQQAMQGITAQHPEVLLTRLSGALLDKFNQTSNSRREETYCRLFKFFDYPANQNPEDVFRYLRLLDE